METEVSDGPTVASSAGALRPPRSLLVVGQAPVADRRARRVCDRSRLCAVVPRRHAAARCGYGEPAATRTATPTPAATSANAMAMRERRPGPSSRCCRTESENRFMRRRYGQRSPIRSTRDTKIADAGHAARNASIAPSCRCVSALAALPARSPRQRT